MTAQEILRLPPACPASRATPTVRPDAQLPRVLSLLLDSPTATVSVTDDGIPSGTIDMARALQACSLMMPQRPESSQVTVTCAPQEYSASSLARAVEDADAHLLDLYTLPAPHGNIRVVLRTSRTDPAPVVHSLRRYGFTVSDIEGDNDSDREQALERIEALRRYFDL